MELEELLKSNANLEEYLKEYGENNEFLVHYYSQDINRILKDYSFYSGYLTIEDKIKLISIAIDKLEYDIINCLIRDIDNMYFNDEKTAELANKLFAVLVELDKNGKIDISKITGSIHLYRSNPIYLVKRNPSAIGNCLKMPLNDLLEILKYLASINYKFTHKEEFFVTYNILPNLEAFSFFLVNCQYDIDIDNCLITRISEISNEEVFELYQTILNTDKKNLSRRLLSRLNYNNYDCKTIINNQDICFVYDGNNKDQILSILKELSNNGIKANIIIVMDHVDIKMVNESYDLVGDKLKILPTAGQISGKVNEYNDIKNKPTYDVEYIRKSEQKLDLYSSMVDDTLDKDGELKSLSPLEKFIAAYILTTKFAPYKEEDVGEKGDKSRSVYEFINSTTGTKIVCVGYTHLLREFLYRMGIKDTMDWGISSGSSISDSLDREDHMRMMVHLVDPKYGIDGIYMSDPTWDNTEKSNTSFRYMLMSHDEVLKSDSSIDEKNLKFNETDKMKAGLKVPNTYDYFYNPISKEVLIKAHLAVEHFLDKNMKMVKDGNYDFLEYCEMAEKLNFYEVFKENKEKILAKISKMSINELEYNYPFLLRQYLRELNNDFNINLGYSNNKSFDNSVIFSYSPNKVAFGIKCYFASEELPDCELTIDDINRIKETVPTSRINENFGIAEFFLDNMNNNLAVGEQVEEIQNKLIELSNNCKNMTSNK